MDSKIVQARKYGKKYLLLIIAVIFVLILAIPYAFGFRIGPDLKIERVGTLYVTGLPLNTSVYLDNQLLGTTKKTGDTKYELVAGSHTVIVSTPGDYPWSAIVDIASHTTTTVNPIFVPMQPVAILLTGTDRTTALAAIASTSLPSIDHPLYLAGGCAIVYVANNQIIAAAKATPGCTPPPYLCDDGVCSPTIIYSPIPKLTAVVRFPHRQDALVFEFGNVVLALALDPRSPQFFAPVLTATAPILGALPDGTIVIHNGNSVFKIGM